MKTTDFYLMIIAMAIVFQACQHSMGSGTQHVYIDNASSIAPDRYQNVRVTNAYEMKGECSCH